MVRIIKVDGNPLAVRRPDGLESLTSGWLSLSVSQLTYLFGCKIHNHQFVAILDKSQLFTIGRNRGNSAVNPVILKHPCLIDQSRI